MSACRAETFQEALGLDRRLKLHNLQANFAGIVAVATCAHQ
jgi:hypothetical protein